ncbi:hypothetical protein Scep_029939 [Stephania cephalantha]|uniref:Uncharacterized protein n=1 Tax=Stephania cephalantha TaxID=152367 RepID=A0AAP0E6F2_9MAGN
MSRTQIRETGTTPDFLLWDESQHENTSRCRNKWLSTYQGKNHLSGDNSLEWKCLANSFKSVKERRSSKW